ncbi:hypothetical protein [Actinomadura kijaniata]|nr:hypothetical protein [Actinomadura kijaniata]
MLDQTGVPAEGRELLTAIAASGANVTVPVLTTALRRTWPASTKCSP